MQNLKNQTSNEVRGTVIRTSEYVAIPFHRDNVTYINSFLRSIGKKPLILSIVNGNISYLFGKELTRVKRGNYIRVTKEGKVSLIHSLDYVKVFTNYAYTEII